MKEYQPLDLLFFGRDDCLGIYQLEGSPEPGKKWEGRGISYPNSRYPERVLRPEDYEAHWVGVVALGIVPVFIDGTTRWFAIDVDDYSIDHNALARKIYKADLPIVHCRSKSGGAHLYCLFKDPVKATDAVALGRKWCKQLGFDEKKTEIFPKQTKFDTPEAKGNWIIIPYFGGKKAQDFAIDSNGKKVEFDDFLQYCQARVITTNEFQDHVGGKIKEKLSQDEIIEESPPCIQRMMEDTLKEGDGRNNAASHLSWYFRRLDEYFETGDWADKLADFNQAYFNPPLSHTELSQVIKNHSRGKYKARCEVNPMAVLCDKEACIKRKFGIGNTTIFSEFQITAITKIDLGQDPIWKVFVNGQIVTMDTETLMSPRKFRQQVLARINLLIPAFKQPQHDEVLAPVLRDALVIEEADLVSSYGKVEACFKQWTANTVERAKTVDKLLDGLPFYDEKSNSIFFRVQDFVLEYRRVYKEFTDDREIYVILRSLGATKKTSTGTEKQVSHLAYPVGESRWFSIKTEGQW